MKTDDLIQMLSSGVEAVDPHLFRRRYVAALGMGVAGAAMLMLMTLGLRQHLGLAAQSMMFWGKIMFPALVLSGALLLVFRLCRPGRILGVAPWGVIAPVLAIWIAAGISLFGASPIERGQMIFGQTWTVCPFNIAMLAVPAFAGAFWAMRGFAPTRPALAGAASGLLAGAVGALVYALHCPEDFAPFVATWYVLGMLIPALVGGVLGPRLLRW
jgi:hypothetical protein